MNDNSTRSDVGKGLATWDFEPIEGLVREVSTTQDVLELMDDVPDDLVILMHTAGATTLAPLFDDISGIICTTGEIGSHVAIISREYGIACLVGVSFEGEPQLAGRRVRLEPSGQVQCVDAA